MQSGNEIYNQYQLMFTIRKIPIFDLYNHYRIFYQGKNYTVLGMNLEDRDNITILADLINV
jgi:hypothetical protein